MGRSGSGERVISKRIINDMKAYKTKVHKLPGMNWSRVSKRAMVQYRSITSRTKRRPYVRSAYFNKQKIFLPLFWSHLHEKLNLRDKTRRLKYFPCAIELIRNSRFDPDSREDLGRPGEILHRFGGITADNEGFFVPIKEDKRSGQKYLISVFPQ